ncbi:hypothetical protein QA640_23630 [Bradyrhizobium sp. CB82]|uniref:hypothetical protein n=1 Tax=Bradyrhizobium sp. CB82 TaxID=3039159 RepID=UPI0024B27C0C|nr:hypothetical protein [Bradyrhizobium sp. CB82]WFU37474.1 hypothetical protein QA640_23630 [Bradyrhizobium sp. CB82]
MLKPIVVSLSLGMIAIAGVNLRASPAAAACNYSSDYARNCADAVSDAAGKAVQYNSNSYRDIEKRVDSLRGAVKECYDCAMEHVERGTNSAFSTSTSTSTSTDDGN